MSPIVGVKLIGKDLDATAFAGCCCCMISLETPSLVPNPILDILLHFNGKMMVTEVSKHLQYHPSK